MEIRSLSATFGRLNSETLNLLPGLNIIEAANESGKSTWMAFLRVMLYGLNTRDRSPGADKRRYFPWSGSSMQGRMDLIADGDAITLTRTTARANSPMGAFSALYTDTATPVPELTSADCGEALLGIPLEIFERSAFIRQSGIPFDQNATLEKRITSLITTGDEDSSYTDAADRLRRQLNRRRHNKTGILPQLESEIRSLEDTLGEYTALDAALRSHEAQQDALAAREAELRRQLHLIDQAENAQRAAQVSEARSALAAAEAVHDTLAAQAAALPSREELAGILGDLSAAETMNASVLSSQQRKRECAAALDAAEQQLAAHPLAPQTPEEAARSFAAAPRPPFPRWAVFLSASIGALIPILHFAFRLSTPLSVGTALLIGALYFITLCVFETRRRKRWEADTARHRLIHLEQVEAYSLLYESAEQKRSACRAAQEACRTISAEYRIHSDRVLSRVRQFGDARTIDEARLTVRDALELHSQREAARQHLEQAQLRLALLSENAPVAPELPSERPVLTREGAEEELRSVTQRLAHLRQQLHMAQGHIRTLGDSGQLKEDLALLQERHTAAQKEYAAIELAAQVLASANAALQSRFSPALGEKSASIFTKLTKGKYNKVLLDKNMAPSAQETGDILSREAFLLSQGAADQLYLAVRLAICDMVLPEGVPILLDDALVTFDDERMAAALDYLVELSERRQILLFTCQHRELRYLSSAHSGRFHAVVPDQSDTII